MIFAYRNVTTGHTTLIRAADWWDANSSLGRIALSENEPLGALAPVLARTARHMCFADKEAFKAWRAEAWSLYARYAAPTA